MTDGIGLAERMLGLPGVVVLEVEDVPGELVVTVESTRDKATCPSCRRRAQAQDRIEVHLRDLHISGRPCRLVFKERRWRCRTTGCVRKTWTEKLPGVAPRQVLTVRAGAEVTLQVGQLCRSEASVAAEYGVGWDTAWSAVRHHGRPQVDEHSYLAATREHTTIFATVLVDLDRRSPMPSSSPWPSSRPCSGSRPRPASCATPEPTWAISSRTCRTSPATTSVSGRPPSSSRHSSGCSPKTPISRTTTPGWWTPPRSNVDAVLTCVGEKDERRLVTHEHRPLGC